MDDPQTWPAHHPSMLPAETSVKLRFREARNPPFCREITIGVKKAPTGAAKPANKVELLVVRERRQAIPQLLPRDFNDVDVGIM